MVIFGLLGFVLGTVLGSLAKALADRVVTNKTFLGRSYCPNCKHQLGWYDLFPILSYLFLEGKCRYCHKKISPEYWIVELITGLIVAGLFYQAFSTTPNPLPPTTDLYTAINFFYNLAGKVFLSVILVIITITDLKKTIIPDRITFPTIIIIFIGLVGITAFRIWSVYESIASSALGKYLLTKTDYFYRHAFFEGMIGNGAATDPLFGGIAAALIVGLFFLILILITRGRGMGGGDLKLGVLLGLFFGFPLTLIVIILAFFIGAVVALALILFGKKHFGQTIPFGPFLALAGFLALFWGPQLLDWYLRLKLY